MRMKQEPEDKRVRLHSLSPQLVMGLQVADSIYREKTAREVFITSGSDGRHGAGSKHPVGYAADLRLPSWYSGDKSHDVGITIELSLHLGKDWDVVLEADHIHIEWDPKEPLW